MAAVAAYRVLVRDCAPRNPDSTPVRNDPSPFAQRTAQVGLEVDRSEVCWTIAIGVVVENWDGLETVAWSVTGAGWV